MVHLTLPALLSFVYSVSAADSLYDSLGNLSPYHKAPVADGLSEELPADCIVDQVMLVSSPRFYITNDELNWTLKMGRHGSRYPLASELVYITNLTTKLGGAADALQNADLPEELAFLKDGYTSSLGHDDLTAPGRKQLFDHGVE